MLCNKCNQPLPDDSEFCQYCGEKLELPIDDKERTENAISIDINAESDKENTEVYTNEETPCMQREPLNEGAPSIQTPATSDKKKRFCKMCGGFVDLETKKCTFCGKQYFKMPRIRKTVLFAALCIVLAALNVFQYIQLSKANEELKKAKFMDDYIVLIGDSNKKYHKYGCTDLDTSYFFAYNIDNAKAKGYRACSKCN